MNCKSYFKPSNLNELKDYLKTCTDNVSYIAGGTDVILHARENDVYKDSVVIDIFGMKDLQGIKEDGDKIIIGAASTHTEVEKNLIVQKYADVLAMACRTVGSVLIRNHSTIAGNICNASPAADTLSSLAVLDAHVKVLRNGEIIDMSLIDVIDKPGKTNLQNKDLVTEIIVNKLPDGTNCDFFKLGRRKALAISRMTISTICHMKPDGIIDLFSMTCGATFPKPMTFKDIDDILIGKKPTEELIKEVAKKLSNKIPEIAGIRKSTIYKQPVCERIAIRILYKMLLNKEA